MGETYQDRRKRQKQESLKRQEERDNLLKEKGWFHVYTLYSPKRRQGKWEK